MFRYGASALRAGDDGAARIRAAATLDCPQTRQCRMRPNEPTTASHAARCSDVAGWFPVIAFATCGSVVPTTSFLSLCFPISPDGAPVPRGVARRPVSSVFAAASWLFSSRRQALILLEHCTACFARPNVRVEAGPAARRQARAGDNVPVPPARAWWLAVGPRLERGVRPHSWRQCDSRRQQLPPVKYRTGVRRVCNWCH